MDCVGSRQIGAQINFSAVTARPFEKRTADVRRRSDSTASHTRPHATRIPDRAIMTQRTYRIDNRASAGSSRTPLARTVTVTLIALTLLARPASAKWLGGTTTATGKTVGESRQGNTCIVQQTAGTPVATQIAYDTGSSNPPEAHVVLQDHSSSSSRQKKEELRDTSLRTGANPPASSPASTGATDPANSL